MSYYNIVDAVEAMNPLDRASIPSAIERVHPDLPTKDLLARTLLHRLETATMDPREVPNIGIFHPSVEARIGGELLDHINDARAEFPPKTRSAVAVLCMFGRMAPEDQRKELVTGS